MSCNEPLDGETYHEDPLTYFGGVSSGAHSKDGRHLSQLACSEIARAPSPEHTDPDQGHTDPSGKQSQQGSTSGSHDAAAHHTESVTDGNEDDTCNTAEMSDAALALGSTDGGFPISDETKSGHFTDEDGSTDDVFGDDGFVPEYDEQDLFSLSADSSYGTSLKGAKFIPQDSMVSEDAPVQGIEALHRGKQVQRYSLRENWRCHTHRNDVLGVQRARC